MDTLALRKDLMLVLEYLLATKTLPPREQAALDRLRIAVEEPPAKSNLDYLRESGVEPRGL